MRVLVCASLVICCANASAQLYRCPQTYPGKGATPSRLSGASMRWGELRGDGWLTGKDEAAQEGRDIQYRFAPDEQAWLVCTYGSMKRIKGRLHDGHEWNQSMEPGGVEWWMKLAPKINACTVQVREAKSRDARPSTWTVSANCESEP